MSVVSAPSRAGRSPYNSEPSIEAPEATNRVGRIKPEPQQTLASLGRRARITTGGHLADDRVHSAAVVAPSDRRLV
jgi:hypothetical protein